MTLTGKIVIKEKTHKTKAHFYEDLVVGDVLHISLKLGYTGHYAVGLKITCGRTGVEKTDTMNNFMNRIGCFRVEESHV